MTAAGPPPRQLSAAVATLVAFGLGCLGAVMMVAGHQPWDGRELVGVTATHGIHLGDAFAVVPLVVGTGLARWCWTRPGPPVDLAAGGATGSARGAR